jgi:hypothetical protein
MRKDKNSRLSSLVNIGNEPHDQMSLLRLLLHSNQFDIEGLIAGARLAKGLSSGQSVWLKCNRRRCRLTSPSCESVHCCM